MHERISARVQSRALDTNPVAKSYAILKIHRRILAHREKTIQKTRSIIYTKRCSYLFTSLYLRQVKMFFFQFVKDFNFSIGYLRA